MINKHDYKAIKTSYLFNVSENMGSNVGVSVSSFFQQKLKASG